MNLYSQENKNIAPEKIFFSLFCMGESFHKVKLNIIN